MKKILIMVLTVAVCGMAFGVDFAGGDGSAANPWQIATEDQLLKVNEDTTASYILLNDITLTGEYTDSLISAGEGSYYGNFTGSYFSGNFNGDGFVVRNLVINAVGSTNVGLFGLAQFGKIENLGIENFSVSSNSHVVGSVIGRNLGQLTNCYATGTTNTVSGVNFVGGLTGLNAGDGNITGCWVDAEVTGSGERVGGLVGQHSNTLSNSYALGNVQGSVAPVGGLVGWNEGGTITSCYAAGNVSSNDQRIGGLIGYSNGGTIEYSYAMGNVTYTGGGTGLVMTGGLVGLCTATVNECFATGDVDGVGGSRVGGLIGQPSGVVSNCYATGDVNGAGTLGGIAGLTLSEISNCYSTGAVTGTGGEIGGFVGRRYSGGPLNGFWDTETSGTTTGIGSGGAGAEGVVTGKTTTEMKTESTFTDAGWDFTDTWLLPGYTNEVFAGYPVFIWQLDSSPADFNEDGIVNLEDFAVLADGWFSEAY
ncbi:MAG: GLUG motif-containing protein [Sedimentisphaeraceae bacterium JB056]